MKLRYVFALCALCPALSCSEASPPVRVAPPSSTPSAPSTASFTPPPVETPDVNEPSEEPTPSHTQMVVVVRYRLERRVNDAPTANFFDVVERTLTDKRGWERAGFDLVRDPDARYRVVLAEGPVVDRLCLPYETRSTYSCQNGPVVALNADRWRFATPEWTGGLAAYRKMLVNHEVGHLLGQHHPDVQCPEPGTLAPIMAQQSTELNGCLPNPWPLDHEIKRAARHDLPLAPPYEEDP